LEGHVPVSGEKLRSLYNQKYRLPASGKEPRAQGQSKKDKSPNVAKQQRNAKQCDLKRLCLRRTESGGNQGGQEGAAGAAWIVKADSCEEIELPGKCSRQLDTGDAVRIETPGGSGWGKV
jgi:hypothetical protein